MEAIDIKATVLELSERGNIMILGSAAVGKSRLLKMVAGTNAKYFDFREVQAQCENGESALLDSLHEALDEALATSDDSESMHVFLMDDIRWFDFKNDKTRLRGKLLNPALWGAGRPVRFIFAGHEHLSTVDMGKGISARIEAYADFNFLYFKTGRRGVEELADYLAGLLFSSIKSRMWVASLTSTLPREPSRYLSPKNKLS